MKSFSAMNVGVVVFVLCALIGSAEANAPAGRYTISAGTVYDTKTRLTWEQGFPTGTYTWSDAKAFCAGLGGSLGGTGWRLPTVNELQTIVDRSQSTAPLIDLTAFPGTPSGLFWSLTPLAGSPTRAWYVVFSNGGPVSGPMSGALNVRCVR